MKTLIEKMKALRLYFVRCSVWLKLQWKQYWCKHPIKTVKYTDYQERYYRCVCDKCGAELWEDF